MNIAASANACAACCLLSRDFQLFQDVSYSVSGEFWIACSTHFLTPSNSKSTRSAIRNRQGPGTVLEHLDG
jgi:hypothetical protein